MMAITQKKRPPTRYSRIWTAAGRLGMSSEEVHDLVRRETGKDSLSQLTDVQVAQIGDLVWNMVNGRPAYPKKEPPSHQGGRPETRRQRARLYKEAMKIGWTPQRVDGLATHMYGVAKQQWLDRRQCATLIETFKDKVRRAKRPEIARLLTVLDRRMVQLEKEAAG